MKTKKEKIYIIKKNFITKLFEVCVKSIRLLQKTNIPTNYEKYNEKQIHKFNNMMINFLLYVAKQQSEPSFRVMIARLALYLYVFLENKTPLQSGGIVIKRGDQIIDVENNKLQTNDLIQEKIVGGIKLGEQIAEYANLIYDQTRNELVSQQQQIAIQAPEIMIIDRNDEFLHEISELKQEILIEDTNIQNKSSENNFTLNSDISSASGVCCSLFMNASKNISFDAFQKISTLLEDAGEDLNNVNVSCLSSFFTNVANATTEDIINEPTITGEINNDIQETFNAVVWEKMKDEFHSIDPYGITDTTTQSGFCCAMGVYTTITYCTICREKNDKWESIEGERLNTLVNAHSNSKIQHFARIAVGVSTGVLMASGVDASSALGLYHTANTIINNPVNNVDSQNYPQTISNNPQINEPLPILIGEPQPRNSLRMRQKNPDNNQSQKGGYQKFKKTKKTKKRKTKINNKKSKRYKIKENNRNFHKK